MIDKDANKARTRPRRRRRVWPALVLVAGVLLLAGSAKAGKVYKYTDERGVVHFVQHPGQAPPRYRKSMKEVEASVNVSSGARERPSLLGRLEREGPGSFEITRVSSSPWLIVVLQLWHSRLGFSIMAAAALIALLVIGMVLARDLAGRHGRKKYLAGLFITCALALVFLWLGLAGSQALSFLRGCQRSAGLGLEAASLDSAQREKLAGFREACERWEGRLEKAAPSSAPGSAKGF